MSATHDVRVEVRHHDGETTLVLGEGAAETLTALPGEGGLVLRRTEAGVVLIRLPETELERHMRIGLEIMERNKAVLAALAKH